MTFKNGYALVIGVGADLPATVADAKAIHDVLIDTKRAAYPPGQVSLLTEETAGREHILQAFDRLAAQVRSKPEASVLIYYSGHGRVLKQTREYFLVPNGFEEARMRETWISGDEFSAKIDQLQAKKITVFLDCCHAAGISKEGTPPYAKNVSQLAEKLDAGSGRAIIASSRDNELSWIFPRKDPYSLFTTCLIEAMEGRGATGDHDGYAKILSVIAYLFDQIPRRSSEQQHPFINRIENLDENYALCAFPAGLRKTKGRTTTGWEDKMVFLLELERSGLEDMIRTLTEKLTYFRSLIASEADPARKFQLQKDILRTKEEQTQALEQLEALQKQIDAKSS